MSSNKSFVLAWVEAYNKGKGAAFIAEKLQLDTKAVSAKAYALRQKGVKLPALRRTFVELNVDELNSLISQKTS